MYSKEEKKKLVKDFWDGFDSYKKGVDYKTPRRWMLNKTGISHLHLRFEAERKYAQVSIEINHKNQARRLEIYEKLERYKNILQEGLEQELMWQFAYERDNGALVCRVYVELTGVDIHRKDQWESMYEFMCKNMTQLQENYLLIKELMEMKDGH